MVMVRARAERFLSYCRWALVGVKVRLGRMFRRRNTGTPPEQYPGQRAAELLLAITANTDRAREELEAYADTVRREGARNGN